MKTLEWSVIGMILCLAIAALGGGVHKADRKKPTICTCCPCGECPCLAEKIHVK